MVARRTATLADRCRVRVGRDRRGQAARAVGVSLLAVLAVCSAGVSVAQAASGRSLPPRKAPHGIVGALSAVAAVPHSSDVWALGSGVTGAFLLRLHNGRVQTVKAPKPGRYGDLEAITAGSPSTIWVAGGRQAVNIQDLPAIYQWNGKAFVADKLPGDLENGDVTVSSISASSATNAWAVGDDIWSSTSNRQVALHWNGKKWSEVITPVGLASVSTSSPTNAWAIGDGDVFVHWNGTVWSEEGTAPTNTYVLGGIVTSSPTNAYAAGATLNSTTGQNAPLILHFNGKTWSVAPMAKRLPHVDLRSIAMAGTSIWAVGTYYNQSDHPLLVVLHSSGGVWSSQPQPAGIDGSLAAVTAASSTRAYAVGWLESVPVDTLMESYNGHSWRGFSS